MIPFLGVPVRTSEGQLGQIYLTKKENSPEFTADDEKIIQMLAAYAAAAIQNARLHENTQRLAILEERSRIGMDLHDGVIQSIYGLGFSLENALLSLNEDSVEAKQRVQSAIDGLNQVIRDLRSYILDLKPRQMGSEGLIGGVKRLVAELKANTSAEVSLITPEKGLKDLPESHSLVLFHICQEALANAAKHAKAKNVQIALWKTKDRALMEIHDDGIGFDMERINESIGHGLGNMQTRVQSIGGDVEISSRLNEGTTVFAWVPRHARG
jgi:signal transduction histidine kinase